MRNCNCHCFVPLYMDNLNHHWLSYLQAREVVQICEHSSCSILPRPIYSNRSCNLQITCSVLEPAPGIL